MQNISHDELQSHNKEWWEENPMTYDWTRTLNVAPFTPEFYAAIDERFFRSSTSFGHPNYPNDPPFSKQIDYASLRGKRVLEIGCGAGAMAAAFAKHGVVISAIDITQTAIDFTRKRFEILNLQGDVRRMDAEHLEFPDEYFDRVWSWGVIHHSANMEAIIAQIHRVLKPNGKAQIMIYHRHSLRNWILAGLYQGIFRAKFLTTPYDEILRQVTDGYIARHVTVKQARDCFSAFKSVRTELTDLSDLSFIPLNVHVEKYLVGKVIPTSLKRSADNWLMKNWGWFLFIEAAK